MCNYCLSFIPFWVIPRRLSSNCRRFGTHYRFHLHRQVNEVCYFIHLPMKMELIVSSETSVIRTQTPGNYPKRNKLHLEHGESLKTRILFISFTLTSFKEFKNVQLLPYIQHSDTRYKLGRLRLF